LDEADAGSVLVVSFLLRGKEVLKNTDFHHTLIFIMPTTTLGVIIGGNELSQIFGVINATLGDFKVLFYLLMGWLIGFWVIQFIIRLLDNRKSLPGELTTREDRIRKSYDIEAEEAGYGYDEEDYDDEEDEE
jgi:hypothetical protein